MREGTWLISANSTPRGRFRGHSGRPSPPHLSSSSGSSSLCVRVCSGARSGLTLCDPRTVAGQAPLSMGCARRGDWSGLPFPPPGDLPDQGSNPGLLHLPHLRRIRHLGSPKLKPTDYKLSQHFNYVTPSTLPCMKEKKYPGNRAI